MRDDVRFAVDRKPRALVIDLTQVEFSAAAGLDEFVAVYSTLTDAIDAVREYGLPNEP